MTIGIGALASEGEGLKPNRLVLIADTKGSFGDEYSMNRLHKVFVAPNIRVYAVAAGKIDRAAELFQVIMDMGKIIHGGTERYGSTMETIGAAADLYKRVRFKLEVLPSFARIPQSLPDMFTDADLTPALLESWRMYDFGCQMLVGTFNKEGQAFLVYMGGTGEVENFTFPGFAAIGSGQDSAMFWLSYRNHNLGFSVLRSAYHAFEAKIMAESSPHVNERLDMLIASGDKWSLISDSFPSKGNAGDPPITIQVLREMFSLYGPKRTDEVK
jgi:hypothetical protein